MPVTTPVVEPTVPTAVLLLIHVPPPDRSVSAVVKPMHTFILPIIVTGNELTVTEVPAAQPVGNV